MDLRKFMGWTMATALVLGIPALTAAIDGTTGADATDSDTMRDGTRFNDMTGMSNMTGAAGDSMGTGGSTLPKEQGMKPTATGSSGTSPDSTTQTGRGSEMGGTGTRGGTMDMDSDTMRRGMRFHGMTGMSNMTGMERGEESE